MLTRHATYNKQYITRKFKQKKSIDHASNVLSQMFIQNQFYDITTNLFLNNHLLKDTYKGF